MVNNLLEERAVEFYLWPGTPTGQLCSSTLRQSIKSNPVLFDQVRIRYRFDLLRESDWLIHLEEHNTSDLKKNISDHPGIKTRRISYIYIHERLSLSKFDLHWEELVLVPSLSLELEGSSGICVIH